MPRRIDSTDQFSRTALVTGAAGGIGRAIALGLVDAGFRVAAADVADCSETVAMITASGGVGVGCRCDVSSTAEVVDLRDMVEAQLGPCGVVVNNAAIGGRSRFTEVERGDLRRMLEVNLEGPFVVSQEFVPAMIERGWGRVINIASTSLYTNTPGLSAYMASKGGLLGLTYGMANDLGTRGVTVNAVSPPALTVTPMFEARIAERKLGQAELDRVMDNQAVKQRGAPDDVVGVIVFLAGDSSRMITGQFLRVDAGMTRP